MEVQKEIKDGHYVLCRVPSECGYREDFDFVWKEFLRYELRGYTPLECINATYYYHFEQDMSECGIVKLTNMIAGMLYLMEKGAPDREHAIVTNLDIQDFETGEYDDLMTPEDLILIKADIAKIKAFLAEHPGLLDVSKL